MKSTHAHKFYIYTIDGSGFVGYHSINFGFYSYLRNWLRNDERFIKFSQVVKNVYDTLKACYEFETGIKFPYYY